MTNTTYNPVCCGETSVWVDNIPGKEYHYCRVCKQEVNLEVAKVYGLASPTDYSLVNILKGNYDTGDSEEDNDDPHASIRDYQTVINRICSEMIRTDWSAGNDIMDRYLGTLSVSDRIEAITQSIQSGVISIEQGKRLLGFPRLKTDDAGLEYTVTPYNPPRQTPGVTGSINILDYVNSDWLHNTPGGGKSPEQLSLPLPEVVREFKAGDRVTVRGRALATVTFPPKDCDNKYMVVQYDGEFFSHTASIIDCEHVKDDSDKEGVL